MKVNVSLDFEDADELLRFLGRLPDDILLELAPSLLGGEPATEEEATALDWERFVTAYLASKPSPPSKGDLAVALLDQAGSNGVPVRVLELALGDDPRTSSVLTKVATRLGRQVRVSEDGLVYWKDQVK